MADLAGGEERLCSRAEEAMRKNDFQWALEMTDHLIRLQPGDKRYRKIRADALTALGTRQTAATARNYYLTQALEAEGGLQIGMMKIRQADFLRHIPIEAFFRGMAVRLDPEKSVDTDLVAGFKFPDTGEAFTVHVRRGVAEIIPVFPEKPDISLTVDSNVWKEIASGLRSPALALLKDVEKEGGMMKIIWFLSMFRDD
jgi:alkyl sulfatase BDS1-like metallo-beta-lactamase superfamily hydrolase